MSEPITTFPAHNCRAIKTPEKLLGRAGATDLLAVEDADLGILNYFTRWERVPGGYRVFGERLACFSIPEMEELENLVLAARGRETTDTATVIRDADHHHASDQSMRSWLRGQRLRGTPARARRHR